MYAIMKYQMRKKSASEIEQLDRVKNSRKKRKEGTYKPDKKEPIL